LPDGICNPIRFVEIKVEFVINDKQEYNFFGILRYLEKGENEKSGVV